MRISAFRLGVHLVGALLLCQIAVAAGAPPAADRDLAGALPASQLEWRLPEGAVGAVLTVLGPDDLVYRKVYEASAALTFGAADLTEATFIDGTYTWELRFVAAVDSSLRRKMEAARAAGDDELADSLREQMRRPTPLEPLSGSFRVGAGALAVGLPSSAPESAVARSGNALAQRDQVIPDDLIVQGSTCVGFDCVNNESFGFDTIRLKENNLRIKFEDTSVGTFPTHDWQLTANDSASGGSDRFSIEDITAATVPFTVRGSAPSNSIFVDNSGRVGFRTSTPVLDIHISDSDTPDLRFEQTNAGGFTAQTWDVAGNEANFFVRDVTGGSRLPFRIRPGAPTSSIDIAVDGQVGIGTAAPEFKLDARGGTAADSSLALTSAGADAAAVLVRRARGTVAAPTAVQSGDLLGGLGFTGHDGTSFPTSNSISFGAVASETWTASAHGARFFIATTPNLSTSPQVSLSIQGNGQVGIGTVTMTSVADKLEVKNGNIRVTNGSFIDDGTTLSVPDYVFEPGYKLMPVDSLRAYLDEHGHLPNVPSRDEIREKGLNLSQFQMRLLEKVEELTLYSVQQHDQLEALRKENDTLRARLDSLARN